MLNGSSNEPLQHVLLRLFFIKTLFISQKSNYTVKKTGIIIHITSNKVAHNQIHKSYLKWVLEVELS